VGTFLSIIRTEHPAALYNGLPAALLRVVSYSGTRLGLYEPIKDKLAALRNNTQGDSSSDKGRNSFAVKAGAGIMSGGLAAVLGNPFELTKTRMQSNDHAAYRNVGHALRSIVRQEGALGLWRGVGPSVVRASLFTSVQMVTYEESKSALRKYFGMADEGAALHVAASMVSGLVTTTVINPADVVKTRIMNSRDGGQSAIQWTREAIQKGLLMRGWTANYVRLGPQILITLVVYEKLRRAAGWSHL
jgi:Mitochondrial carrier protein